MSSANESELLPVSLSHLRISAIEVEPSWCSSVKGVTWVTEVQHPERRRRARLEAGRVNELPAILESLADWRDCLASGSPGSMMQL